MSISYRIDDVVITLLSNCDITELEVDAIVNAANQYLEHGGGVAAAIVRKGGHVIQEESREWVRRYGPVPVGGVAVTSAGSLKARYVIHAVGPRCGIDPIERLREAVKNALLKAEELSCKSIAFPAISTGAFGCPYDKAAYEMAIAFKEAVPNLKAIKSIIVCLRSDDIFNAFKAVFDEMFGQ